MNTLQVSPDESFSLNWTAMAIVIPVLGGVGRLEGPVIGTLAFVALRESAGNHGARRGLEPGAATLARIPPLRRAPPHADPMSLPGRKTRR